MDKSEQINDPDVLSWVQKALDKTSNLLSPGLEQLAMNSYKFPPDRFLPGP